MKQGFIHLNRFLDSGEKENCEFAKYCWYGPGVMNDFDCAANNATGVTKIKLLFKQLEIMEVSYNKRGSYWPTKLGGKCDYDFKNKECLDKPYF